MLERQMLGVQENLDALRDALPKLAGLPPLDWNAIPARIGTTYVRLHGNSRLLSADLVMQTFQALERLSMWTQELVVLDPTPAKVLARRLAEQVSGSARALNQALADGAGISVIFTQTDVALDALSAAIAAERDAAPNPLV